MRVFGITGWKDQGKTTLVTALVSYFTAAGLRVSTVKHAHRDMDIDQPGRDSHRHRQAGAAEVLLASSERLAIMTELRGAEPPHLPALLARLSPVDLVLVEGFKSADHPKIEVYREDRGAPPLALTLPTIRAVAGVSGGHPLPVPLLPLDDIPRIAAFVRAEAA